MVSRANGCPARRISRFRRSRGSPRWSASLDGRGRTRDKHDRRELACGALERMVDTQVLIVGAGPTGLTLAVALGQRGVRCTLIEQKEAPQFLPKMERCNARTMEIYRRMGIVEQVRAAGLPAHCPMDVFIVFNLVEPPLVHHP